MAGEWREISLGKACSKIGSGATPRGGKDAYLGGDTALIRSQNIYNNRFVRDGLVFIDNSQADELKNVIVENGDVLLNITGDSVARCCQVNADILPARVNQHVAIIRPNADVIDAAFLRYWLVSPLMQAHLLALASAGATRNALTKSMIESLSVIAPPVPEQRAIAHILGTLDDKIELNRRRNQTLEAMARALFKEWFVDFGPVRAKMEGRWKRGQSLPGLPAHLYDLFPDRLVESELREIPEGWEVGAIANLAQVTIGGDWGKDQPEREHCVQAICLRGVDLEHLRTSGDCPKAPLRWVKKSSIEKRQIQSTDLLIGGSGAGPCGRPLYASPLIADLFDNPVIYSNFVKRFRCKNTSQAIYLDNILWGMFDSGVIKDYINGTSVPNLNDKGLMSHPVILPGDRILKDFEMVSDNWLRSLYSRESRTLATLRDALLPKLISGELRVPDARQEIEETLL